MTTRKPCTLAKRAGRLIKAEQFLKAAEIVRRNIDDINLADALITLSVHAGIAASDVISCDHRGIHHIGPSHAHAIQILRGVNNVLASELQVLLNMKGKSGYGEELSTKENAERAYFSAKLLVESALRRSVT